MDKIVVFVREAVHTMTMGALGCLLATLTALMVGAVQPAIALTGYADQAPQQAAVTLMAVLSIVFMGIVLLGIAMGGLRRD